MNQEKKTNLLVTEQHQLKDNLDEKVAKLNEIEKQRSANVFQSTQTSLSDELEKVTVDEMKEEKRIDALTKLNELGEVKHFLVMIV